MSPAAAALFAELDSTNRYAILYRVGSGKKPETRAKKIAGFVGQPKMLLEADRRWSARQALTPSRGRRLRTTGR